MSEDKINKAIEDAAANVAIESGEVDKKALEDIKKQIEGLNNKSDESFIFSLVKSVGGKKHGK